ncbi:MAG: TonB-dependent receptor [Balneolaceae bacterium]|nr:TonB-dependent receptor [Balneolaceae bacterium]
MKNLLVLLSVLLPGLLYGQETTGTVEGTVTSEGAPVAGANVGFESIQKGGSTDLDGRFAIREIPAGSYILRISAVGFETWTKPVEIRAGKNIRLEVELRSSVLELGQVVVTGTMKETFVKDSPVKVNVVSSRFLGKNPGNNLMENVGYINGLYEQVDCGVCGTSNIRINGMEGPYTSILIDGMPIMGSLASVYGLNGIGSNVIESIEIIKGPNSTLYGSEAMGGVINVRTKDPASIPAVSVDAYGTTHEEGNLDFTISPAGERFNTLVSGNLFYFDRFMDHNNDTFADVTRRKRVSLFNKWSFKRPQARTFTVAGKYYYEDRIGGVEAYTKELRGSDRVYGEAIETNRFELVGSYQLPIGGEHIRTDFSYSWHNQDSFYGDYHYTADQRIYFTNLIWDKRFSAARQLLVGGTVRYDRLNQTFDGILLEDGSEDRRFTPGLFGQYEHIFSDAFRGLAGLRIDHYVDHGFIYSPRLSLKADAGHHTTVRLNAGTGFRIVNLFTEEHEALTGSRQVVITENLSPERSYNSTLNINQIIDIGVSVLNIDLDLFYTYFTNQIIPDYSVANEIRYSNLEGHAVTRGISLSAAHNFPGPLQYSIGVTLQDVYQQEGGSRSPLPFAPDYSGVFTLSYAFSPLDLSVDYTGRITGPMPLPEYEGYANRSEWFTEQNIKLSKQLSPGIQIYGSVKNLFNYTQDDPLIAPERPFSDEFATDHVYGPLQTRRLLLGIRYEMQ